MTQTGDETLSEPGRGGQRRGKNMDWVPHFEGQMLVCGLLAKALYGEPDRAWLESLAKEEVLCAIPFAAGTLEMNAAGACFDRWTRSVRDGVSDEAFDAIVNDTMRLFVGPARLAAAPWESVYVGKERAVFQRESTGVKNWYRRFGLELSTRYNEPADHVGLQFAFVAHLSQLIITASEIRDGAEVKRLLDALRGFLAQHMLPWVPRWADDVLDHAGTEYYRGLGWMAHGAVLEAGAFLSIAPKTPPPSGPFRVAERS